MDLLRPSLAIFTLLFVNLSACGDSGTAVSLPNDAGTGGSGGNAGSQSTAGSATGGGAGTAGAAGSAAACNGVHPNLDGGSRTCDTGACFCADPDNCFPEAVASSCCSVTVVCDPASPNPVATINHPGENETRLITDGAFPFAGVATDPQDGALTGASLVWTSSLDGPIGTGLTFSLLPSVGIHVITLTATDTDSNTGTDSITLTME